MKWTNRIISLALVFFPCLVLSQVNVSSALGEFVSSDGFKHASISVSISDVNTGKSLISYNSQLSLIPASCLKLITTATALEILGPNYKFKTELLQDGVLLKDGTLYGNLIVKGYGDPCLNSVYFPNSQDVISQFDMALLSKGVKRITGGVVADDSYFKSEIPSTWIWEDIANYYGATAHALSYMDNYYTLFFNSSGIGKPTTIDRVFPINLKLKFENSVVSSKSNRDNAYIFGDPKTNFRFIKGSIPSNKKDFTVKGANANPAIVIANDIAELLPHNGVRVSDVDVSASLNNAKICTHYSPALSHIISITNHSSVNLFAEHILLSLNKENTSYKTSISKLLRFWQNKKISISGICICDGSGLSRSNLLNTRFIDEILMYMYKSKNFDAFYSSLPVAGVSGTLSGFAKNTNLNTKLVAKTGTIRKVRAICGYLNTKSNKILSVSIIVNNNNKSFKIVNKSIETLLLKLYNL